MNIDILNRSRKLKEFVHEIKFRNRNPKDNSVLDMLDDKSSNPVLVLKAGMIIYRARIFTGEVIAVHEGKFVGFSEKDSFVPPHDKTLDMRANYRYIPYLYCSDIAYGAVCEVHPRFGAFVSIAEIEVNGDIELFDFAFDNVPNGMDQTKENLCRSLSELFAKPVTTDDDITDYIPTQYIAEYIKNIGYDGIVYRSAVANSSKNYAIFNYEKCKAVSSSIYSITGHIVEIASMSSFNPITEIKGDIQRYLEKL
jgi:hypothetical protein